MASNQMFLILAAIVAVHLVVALSTEYKVGDAQGWTVNFNYTTWAEDKEFWVGDNLVFAFTKGSHNVIKTTGPVFQSCQPGRENKVLTTGNYIIALATLGKKWYICGVGNHCTAKGRKLAITVQQNSQAPAPAPSWQPRTPVRAEGPTSSVTGITAARYQVTMLVAVATALSFMV